MRWAWSQCHPISLVTWVRASLCFLTRLVGPGGQCLGSRADLYALHGPGSLPWGFRRVPPMGSPTDGERESEAEVFNLLTCSPSAAGSWPCPLPLACSSWPVTPPHGSPIQVSFGLAPRLLALELCHALLISLHLLQTFAPCQHLDETLFGSLRTYLEFPARPQL